MYASGGTVKEYKKGGKVNKPYEKPALSAKQLEKKRHEKLTKEEKELAKKEGLSFIPVPDSLKRSKRNKPGRKLEEGGKVNKRSRKRKSSKMTESTHPGVDKIRDAMIQNEKDYETGNVTKEVWKTKQTILRNKLKEKKKS